MAEESKELKKCSACKCTMLLEPYFSINRKGEYYKTCDKCRERKKKHDQAYYKKNKERVIKRTKDYHEKNRDSILLRRKAEYEKNKVEILRKQAEYNQNNKDIIKIKRKEKYWKNRDENIAKTKEWTDNNKEKVIQWKEENKEKIRETTKIYREKNRDKRNTARRMRKENDPVYKLTCTLRCRLYHAIKKNIKSKPTLELLGCETEFLKQHLENQFTEGMTWENHGEWHVDHIKPCAKFDLSLPEEQQKCFHYTNLQPLWAIDNMKKGDTYEE